LLDRAGGNTNPFPPVDEYDFRKPENLNLWMLNTAGGEKYFPLLHAYLSARYQKRGGNDFMLHDYLSRKLWNQSFDEVCKEYRNGGAKDPAKLNFLALNTNPNAGKPFLELTVAVNGSTMFKPVNANISDDHKCIIDRELYLNKSKARG
jgi:hypothetical protein